MIVVAGECLVDLIVDLDGAVVAAPGGGPYNTARGVARLGGDCAFLGRVSNDRFGRLLRRVLVEDGVSEVAIVATDAPTTLAVAELDCDGSATYAFHFAGTAAPMLRREDVAAALPAVVSAFHVGTLALALEPIASTLEAVALGLQPTTLVMLDPNCRPSVIDDQEAYAARIRRVAERADVVKVSIDDLAFLAPGVGALAAAGELVDQGTCVVLVTDGPRDVSIVTAAGVETVASPPVKVVDTVGAGDAFGAGFLAFWVGRHLRPAHLGDAALVREAVEYACHVAAATCERAGAVPPLWSELPDQRRVS
jgi:fructokinase